MVEQPRGSLLEESPLLKRVFHMLKTYRKPFNMGCFGAATKKAYLDLFDSGAYN